MAWPRGSPGRAGPHTALNGPTRAVRALQGLLQPGWRSAAMRLLLVGALLFPAALHGSHSLLQAALPTMTRVFEALAPDLQVTSLGLARNGQQQRVQAKVELVRTLAGNGLVIDAGPHRTAQASTPALNGLLTPLLAALAIAAWPVHGGGREALARVLLCPALLLWFWLDAPLTLASTLWRPLADVIAPGQFSPLAAAEHFLSGGGRIAGALILAALVLTMARWLSGADQGVSRPASAARRGD